MKMLKFVFKNALRHKLRASLTIVGIAIAVLAFGLLRTVVTAWYAGVDASAADRLITRHAVSFIFQLPFAYKDQVSKVEGIEKVSFMNWFGGIYIDENNFFPRMACDPETIFEVYPEYLVDKDELETFKKERNSCVIGAKLALQYGFKIGDIIPIEGDIYPGKWEFVVRGIYKPRVETADATQMFFHWNYLNERLRAEDPSRAGGIGWLAVKIQDPSRAAEVSEKIDALFRNSRAETKTETERAFQQSFVTGTDTIITALNFMSFVIIGIIMLVLGNTMIMSARERTREYAVLKTLGYSGRHLFAFIAGESLVIAVIGAGIGLALLFPSVYLFEAVLPKGWFPIFDIKNITIVLAATAALVVGVLAAFFPIRRALTMKIVDGLRFVG